MVFEQSQSSEIKCVQHCYISISLNQWERSACLTEVISPGWDLAQSSRVDLLGIVSNMKLSYELWKCVAGTRDFGSALELRINWDCTQADGNKACHWRNGGISTPAALEVMAWDALPKLVRQRLHSQMTSLAFCLPSCIPSLSTALFPFSLSFLPLTTEEAAHSIVTAPSALTPLHNS